MKTKPTPTDSELEILRVLWDHGPSTVRDVHEHLNHDSSRGYTTILKLMQIMSDKGLVRRNENQRAHIYRAAVTAKQVQGTMLRNLLDRAFDNSTAQLIMQALASRRASKSEIAEIRKMLDDMEDTSS